MFLSLFPSVKRLQEENERLQEENKKLIRDVEYYKKWFLGEHTHSEEIKRVEKSFIKVFRQLHLHVSSEAFTLSSLENVDIANAPNIDSGNITNEDFKIWCMQIAKKRYGNNTGDAIMYAQKLYDFVSNRYPSVIRNYCSYKRQN